jgi:hypothetical protein
MAAAAAPHFHAKLKAPKLDPHAPKTWTLIDAIDGQPGSGSKGAIKLVAKPKPPADGGALDSTITPLEFLLNVMSDPAIPAEQYPAARRNGKVQTNPAEPPLSPEASAVLRDRLLGEINELAGGDEAALWAHRSLAEKNKLTAADALCVEERFQARLASFATPDTDKPQRAGEVAQPSTMQSSPPAELKNRSRSKGIDKSVLALPEPRRVRDRDHVRHVAKQPCLICGRQPSDPHHLRFTQSRALGRKVSDEFTVPLCRGHHREVHQFGDEAAWWRKIGVDPTVAARALWLETHPLSTGSENLSADVEDAPASDPTDKVKGKSGRHAGGRPARRKTKSVRDKAPYGVASSVDS